MNERPGIERAYSVKPVAPMFSKFSSLIAEMVAAVSCKDCSRRNAVTTISSITAPDGAVSVAAMTLLLARALMTNNALNLRDISHSLHG